VEVIYALIVNLFGNKNYDYAFELWTKTMMTEDSFKENEDIVTFCREFDEKIPQKLVEFILNCTVELKKLVESKYFELEYLVNSVSFLFNSKNNEKGKNLLEILLSMNRPIDEKKEFLIKVLDEGLESLDERGSEIILDFINKFEDEEIIAELTTYLLKFM